MLFPCNIVPHSQLDSINSYYTNIFKSFLGLTRIIAISVIIFVFRRRQVLGGDGIKLIEIESHSITVLGNCAYADNELTFLSYDDKYHFIKRDVKQKKNQVNSFIS